MAKVTYTVKKGDTLSAIALKYDTTVNNLVKLNNIKDPDYIVVGQVLTISGEASTSKKNNSNKATIGLFGLQSNTDRTLYATWDWDKDETENYEVKWQYATGDGVGFIGNKTTVDEKQSVYTAPENATHVAFYVKPISKKKKVNNKETSYWTAEWSTRVAYYFKDNPPSTPPVPDVEIKDYQLTAQLNNLDVNGTTIQFQIVKNDKSVYNSGKAEIKTNAASYSCTIAAGNSYKVRCRAIRDDLYSEWSDYSANYETTPAAPDEILELRALSETSVYLDWSKVSTAKNYEIQYAEKKSRFDSSDEAQTLTVESVVSHAEIDGLETGKQWFFRVRATNDIGASGWTAVKSVKIGTKPAAPTTWSSTTTATTGKAVNLYWVHNSEDGSSQTYAELELDIGGTIITETIQNSTDEDEKDKTSQYIFDTSGYTEGVKVLWRVRTRGILPDYSDWSMQRTIDIYAPPTLEISVTDNDANELETLTSFPFYLSATAGPNTQKPIGYHVSVVSNNIYETTDSIGNNLMVNAGEEVYSRYFDITDPLLMEFSANNIDLENNINYTVTCVVSMDSGLNATASSDFTVAWEDVTFWPNAEIAYDPTTYTTGIRPYCQDEAGVTVEGITLSVYRREFDGTFTEIGKGIVNGDNTFITDPHPSLDYARYRIVATTVDTGKVTYYDMPGYLINEKAIIIQWNEEWSIFDVAEGEVAEQPAWSGSLLRLPYNIDVSDSYNPDVAIVEYIGRKHPVTYYGTHIGETATWSVDIEKKDIDTLYALRRLATWMGDVYVREPSGSGYWAKVTVSFSQKHREPAVPVTLDITRVAGGV